MFISENPLEIEACFAVQSERDDTINYIDELMSINYLISPYKVNENLDINPDLPYDVVTRIMQIYEKDYYSESSREVSIIEPEMFMKVKHDQLITFR